MIEGLIRVEEAAARVGLSVSSLYNAKDLPPPRMRVGNVMLFAKEDIDHWQASRVDRRKLTGRRRRK